jgi:hypothetical protein
VEIQFWKKCSRQQENIELSFSGAIAVLLPDIPHRCLFLIAAKLSIPSRVGLNPAANPTASFVTTRFLVLTTKVHW